MTEAAANNDLIKNEKFYFNLLPNFTTDYAAVVKNTNDFAIQDDYDIELGLCKVSPKIDLNLAYDAVQSKIAALRRLENIQFVETNNVKLQCKKLEKLTGGCSVFYEKSDNKSGTAGAFFKIKSDNHVYMLSNRHVIVDNDEEENTKIVHPAAADAIPVYSENLVGKVSWTCSKKEDRMDAAIAKIKDYPVDVGRFSISPQIKILGVTKPKIGQNVKKYGNTSQLSFGEIRSTNCTVNPYDKKGKLYRNQILTSFMTLEGDSGSALVTDDDKLVGLLFAGDNYKVSFANSASYIFNHTDEKFKLQNISKFV